MSEGKRGPLRLLAVAVAAAAGCAIDQPVVSPKFQALAPVRIAVLPVENATLVDLTRVTTAGLLQGLISKREINVPEAMQRGMVAALEKKGYATEWISSSGEVDFHVPIKPPLPAYDGALYCRITSWRLDSPGGEANISVGGTAELVRVSDADHSGGESLFKVDFDYRTSTLNPGVRTSLDLEEEGERAGMAAVRSLPKAPKPTAPAAKSTARSAAGGRNRSAGGGPAQVARGPLEIGPRSPPAPPPIDLLRGPGSMPAPEEHGPSLPPPRTPPSPLLVGPGIPPREASQP